MVWSKPCFGSNKLQMHYCVQSNFSTKATLGTESCHCREVAFSTSGASTVLSSLSLNIWHKTITLGITASVQQVEKFFLATSQCCMVNSVFQCLITMILQDIEYVDIVLLVNLKQPKHLVYYRTSVLFF